MKFPNSSILSLVFATSAVAAPAIQAAAAQQPASIYPIGTNGGSNARVAGRLFNIDGKVEYFAGNVSISQVAAVAEFSLGSNAWWLAHLSKNSDVDIALAEVANVRIAFQENW